MFRFSDRNVFKMWGRTTGGLKRLLLTSTLFSLGIGSDEGALSVDPKGYIMYCPCMGRFGNQADHFLGALGFAKGLDRTLVLPPWIEYQPGERGSSMVPFDAYFNVSAVNHFHRAVTMEQFVSQLSDTVWPVGKRTSFCYTARRGETEQSCNAKEGNPFGPFWDTFNVSFDRSEMYGPLSYDVYHQNAGKAWNQKYPATQFPVLAFTGAPASFPVQQDNLNLQQFLVYNDGWKDRADRWIKSNLPRGPFVGIHLRNGVDWDRACEHVTSSNHLFSSPQCLGYKNEKGEIYIDLCKPAELTIIKQIKKAVKKVGAVSLFIASDNNYMTDILSKELRGMDVTLHHQPEVHPSAHLDLAVLSRSNFFIGNCISSFTAFVKRARDVDGLPSGFWGYPRPRRHHDEF